MRLRHYGFLANRCRTEKLKQIRAVLAQGNAAPATSVDVMSDTPFIGYPCPKCHQGMVHVVCPLAPMRFEGG